MPLSFWASWKRALSCKIDGTEKGVHKHVGAAPSWCARSYSNLRDVMYGNIRVLPNKEASYNAETKHRPHSHQRPSPLPSQPSTTIASHRTHSSKLSTGCYDCSSELLLSNCQSSCRSMVSCSSRFSSSSSSSYQACRKCGESFSKTEFLHQHYATHHTVSELKDGDSARNIVEIIFRTSWRKAEFGSGGVARVERVMKVHNPAKVVSGFEEYREGVKARASKRQRKEARCVADGNEVLRFYCTTVGCGLGVKGSPTVCCLLSTCSLCHILRFGLHAKEELGIYTTASSAKAHHSALSLLCSEHGSEFKRKDRRAMLVCRVIAGRIKKLFHETSQHDDLHIYDSLAGDAGPYSNNPEDLLVFNPKAVLPCFIVIYHIVDP